jgi:hypothetical protein
MGFVNAPMLVTADYVTLLYRAADPVAVNTFVGSGMDLATIRQAIESGSQFFVIG